MTPALFLATAFMGTSVVFGGTLLFVIISPLILLGFMGAASVGVVALSVFLFRKQLKPVLQNRVSSFISRHIRRRPSPQKGSQPIGSSTQTSLTASILNRFKPGGRILKAGNDRETNKKNWWRFVNSIDATVYLSDQERQKFEERVKAIRDARRRERKLSQVDTMSDVDEDDERDMKQEGYQVYDSPEEVGSAPEYPENETTDDEDCVEKSAATNMSIAGSIVE